MDSQYTPPLPPIGVPVNEVFNPGNIGSYETKFPIVTPLKPDQRTPRVLLRDIYTSGTLPGVVDLFVGGKIVAGNPTGQRVVLDNASQSMKIYDSTGTLQATIAGLEAGPDSGAYITGSNKVFIKVPGIPGGTLVINVGGVSSLSDLSVIGDFSATGVKAFDVPHPSGKKEERLKYIAVESPEVLVTCRGIAESEEEIKYPKHFTDMIEENSIQCLVGKLKGSSKISWLATGVRKGFSDFNPEYTVIDPKDE